MIRDTSAQDTALAPDTRRRKLRLAIGAGAALLAAGIAATLLSGWHAGTQSVNAQRLRIAPVTRGTLVRDAAVNGRVVAAVSPTLYATAASTVTLKVNAGDTVKKGDVLAVLESPDLAGALKREQSSFEELQAEVLRQQLIARKAKLIARRDADQAEIERIAAQRAYERVEAAGIEGVIAKNDFQKAQDTLKSAQIRSKHASEAALLENDDVDLQLKTRLSQLQRQKIALDLARQRVDELTLRSPMDGFIGSLAVANRAVVAANAPLMTLVDLTRLEVELEIPETYVADLGIGMNVEITAGEIKATGKLSALSPEVVRNQVLARVRFSGAQPQGLRQSQRVQARLLIDEKANVLMLPRGPFVEAQGGHYVYVVEDGVARRRPVTLGAMSVAAVEVAGGLKAGEQVVISGTEAFDNAEAVSINP
ncbi:efflux RND transporter periplasmic adaptor subunit [Caenimonas aquaedulcis]|uniref:Efflux RND transporter periplasmic adaptor subunit n=1 Tax=Caenimonas aquaedulcis TaxID=2793270 RepID=A0A931MH01_9BURK|nr:efflux RND transporter periplasmic adaptor subunit [Caenimonas aquaedulcis]MBG9388636.1 efflux RND transporter periplasmic adaptor subunit [Caenimonas aquaedulcis]